MQLAKSSMKALWDGLLAMGDKNKVLTISTIFFGGISELPIL